jgi:peptidoglycan/LPS O-acetylase OafA/YrhL
VLGGFLHSCNHGIDLVLSAIKDSDVSPSPPASAGRAPLPLIVALRALAALIILWHHFALYPPLREWAAPLLGEVLDWFEIHARATQVFFVVGGYVMARSMNTRHWGSRAVGGFIRERYFRLGLPYLAVIAIVLPVYLFARGWVPDAVLGQPVAVIQLLAHLFFLQDILGYEPLSAGLWFVCINFQIGLLYVATLWLRDVPGGGRLDFVGLTGWGLAIFSLFHANLDSSWDVWALYFFPYFFMGVIVHRAQRGGVARLEFWLFQALLVAAMLFEWRWRLGIALVVGLLLLAGDRRGFAAFWPRSRLLAWLGKISYSLFLIHFPVLVLVAAIWARLGWNTPELAVAGLLVAFVLSVVSAAGFHRWIETPAARLARKFRPPAGIGRQVPAPAWAR